MASSKPRRSEQEPGNEGRSEPAAFKVTEQFLHYFISGLPGLSVTPPRSAGSTKTLLLSPSFTLRPRGCSALTLLKGFRPQLPVNISAA